MSKRLAWRGRPPSKHQDQRARPVGRDTAPLDPGRQVSHKTDENGVYSMSDEQVHAKVFDLPGWPCPPKVRDIPNHKGSWGWVAASDVVQDDLGYLWVHGDVVPQYKIPDSQWGGPGAIVCWTEQGLGLWVHPKSYEHLKSMFRLDMETGSGIPVARVFTEMP